MNDLTVVNQQYSVSQNKSSIVKIFSANPRLCLSLLLLADVLNRLDDFGAILKPIENLKAIEKLFSDKTRS